MLHHTHVCMTASVRWPHRAMSLCFWLARRDPMDLVIAFDVVISPMGMSARGGANLLVVCEPKTHGAFQKLFWGWAKRIRMLGSHSHRTGKQICMQTH